MTAAHFCLGFFLPQLQTKLSVLEQKLAQAPVAARQQQAALERQYAGEVQQLLARLAASESKATTLAGALRELHRRHEERCEELERVKLSAERQLAEARAESAQLRAALLPAATIAESASPPGDAESGVSAGVASTEL